MLLGWLAPFDVDKGYSPRQVEQLGVVRCGERADYSWVRIEPPIERGEAGNHDRIEVALLAPRHEGYPLESPVSEPVHVYVCSVRNISDQLPAEVAVEDVIIRHWGIIYPSQEAAAN